jgi:hypothetical protein
MQSKMWFLKHEVGGLDSYRLAQRIALLPKAVATVLEGLIERLE